MSHKEAVKKSIPREILEWIVCIVVAFILAVLIKYFIFTPTLVKQPSMFPTIFDGDRVFVNRLVRTFHIPLERGDIITFEKPSTEILDPEQIEKGEVKASYAEYEGFKWFTYNMLEWDKISYIKRIIGISGDHIYISDEGEVYVNDEKIDESNYLPDWTNTPHYYGRGGISNDFIVPEGYVFAMGDNREGSQDCRRFGCIPVEKIEGKVLFRLWPLDRFGSITKSTLTYEEAKKELDKMHRLEL